MGRFLFALLLAALALDAGTAPIVIPFEFYDNAIWIDGTLNGTLPLKIQLDTAAGACVLNSSRIKDTGLPVLKEWDQESAGSGDKPTHLYALPSASFEFGGVKLEFPNLIALPLDEVSNSYGKNIDAIVGYQLMAKYVVKIDFDQRTLTLYDPAAFEYNGSGAVLPLDVGDHTPVVRARIGVPGKPAIEGRFLVDEPHPGALLFATPFIRQNDLLPAARSVARMFGSSATGVGGRFELLDGRVESLQLGPYTMKRPTAGFPEARSGAFARTDIAGIIGGEVWRRFRVWLDYPHGRIILEPGPRFADDFLQDSSGLKVRSAGSPHDVVLVAGVEEQTPAARAGLQKGDRILEFAGQSKLSVWEIRCMLRTPGQKYRIRVRRGSQELDSVLETEAPN
jgi:hypothetical protein